MFASAFVSLKRQEAAMPPGCISHLSEKENAVIIGIHYFSNASRGKMDYCLLSL